MSLESLIRQAQSKKKDDHISLHCENQPRFEYFEGDTDQVEEEEDPSPDRDKFAIRSGQDARFGS